MYNPLKPERNSLIEAAKAIAKFEVENKPHCFPEHKIDLSSLIPEIPKPDYSGVLKLLGIKEQPVSRINLSSFIPDPPKLDSLALPKLFGLPKSQQKVSLPSTIFGSLVPKPKEKHKVFISFDYDNDKYYKYLLEAWDANPEFDFVFSDVTPTEIDSNNVGRIKAALTSKIKLATHTLVIVGKEANKRHPKSNLIEFKNWINFEVYQSVQLEKKLALIRLDDTCEFPEQVPGGIPYNTEFTQENVINVLNRA